SIYVLIISYLVVDAVKSFNGKNQCGRYLLTMLCASIFLFLVGILAHNVFADSVTATIPVGVHPWGVGVNPVTNMIYVTNEQSNTNSVIDGSTNSVVSTIQTGSFPWGVGVNPNTNKIYVADGNGLEVIDGSTNSVVSKIHAGGYYSPGIN